MANFIYVNSQNLDVENDLRDCISLARHLYNAGYRKENSWISVKDRLPTEEGRYLVMVEGMSEPIMKRWSNLGLFIFASLVDLKYGGKEIYWMPLPKGPEADNNV